MKSAEHPYTPADYRIESSPDDRLLLCSDGLSGLVPAEIIACLLREAADPAAAVEQLIDAALVASGRDNVTVIVAEAREESPWSVHSPH